MKDGRQFAGPDEPRSWRELSRKTKPRPLSARAKRRRLGRVLRLAFYLGVFAAGAFAAYEVHSYWKRNPNLFRTAKEAKPLREIELNSDGVLDRDWVSGRLRFPEGIALMEVDIDAARVRLEEGGQVETAVLARKFPDVLVVRLRERLPVAKIKGERALMVARDGVVYEGHGYERGMVDGLPFLTGAGIVPGDAGFGKIEGMDVVAELLGTANSGADNLYRSFREVSLARLATDHVLVVKMAEVERVTFGLREDFYRQLARLDLILEELRAKNPGAGIKSVDLSVSGSQVPVLLDESAPAQTDSSQRNQPRFFQQ